VARLALGGVELAGQRPRAVRPRERVQLAVAAELVAAVAAQLIETGTARGVPI
jgi:hypothetical protein